MSPVGTFRTCQNSQRYSFIGAKRTFRREPATSVFDPKGLGCPREIRLAAIRNGQHYLPLVPAIMHGVMPCSLQWWFSFATVSKRRASDCRHELSRG
jgi:hypothetical protein